MKSKQTTWILALLLGGFGAHRFYLGQTGRGLLALCFCWTFIPSIIAFIDFIIFVAMTDGEFNRKYNGMTGTDDDVKQFLHTKKGQKFIKDFKEFSDK